MSIKRSIDKRLEAQMDRPIPHNGSCQKTNRQRDSQAAGGQMKKALMCATEHDIQSATCRRNSSRSMDKRLAAQGKPMEPSKWALERARKFLDGVLLVDKNSTDMADRAARFSLAREFDAIAADATEKEAVRLGVETHRIIQEHRRERDEAVEKELAERKLKMEHSESSRPREGK